MQKMIADGSWSKESVNWTQSDVNNNFKAGNLAMQQNGPWQLPNLKSDAPELNFGVTTLPKLTADSKQATSILGGENMGVVKKDNNEGAIEFLKFYDQDEVMVEAMQKYGSFPPKTKAAQDPYWVNDEVQKMFIKQMETSIPRGPSPKWPSYSTALQTSVQEAMTNKKSAEDAAKSAQKAVDAVK
jgi:multiple sugar transport system substrate-binding protein